MVGVERFLLLVEEMVAGSGKLLPHILAVLACNRTYLFPLLLQLDEFVGCLFPFGAVLQFLRLAQQIFLRL